MDVVMLEALAGVALAIMVVGLFIAIFFIVCQWKIFKKAGEEGWKSIIPIYNTYIYLKICGISGWFMLIFFLPLIPVEGITLVASVISGLFSIYSSYRLSKSFGHGVGFTIGLVLLPIIFIPILAFGSSEYSLDA